jgi:hypothetical protein
VAVAVMHHHGAQFVLFAGIKMQLYVFIGYLIIGTNAAQSLRALLHLFSLMELQQ